MCVYIYIYIYIYYIYIYICYIYIYIYVHTQTHTYIENCHGTWMCLCIFRGYVVEGCVYQDFDQHGPNEGMHVNAGVSECAAMPPAMFQSTVLPQPPVHLIVCATALISTSRAPVSNYIKSGEGTVD